MHHTSDLETWTQFYDASLTHPDDASASTLDMTSVSTGQTKQFYRAAGVNYDAVPFLWEPHLVSDAIKSRI